MRGDRLILSLIGTVGITDVRDVPIASVMLAVYAEERSGGAYSLGVMVAARGGGLVPAGACGAIATDCRAA